MAPVMESIEKNQEKAKVIVCDIDRERALAKKYDVKAIPTILLLKDGEEVDRVQGIIAEQYLREKIDDHF